MKILCLLFLVFMQTACSCVGLLVADVQVKKSCNNTPHCFEKIQAAIDAAPANSIKPYRIIIANGDYREKVILNKNNIQLVGQSTRKARLVFGDYAGIILVSGKNLGTPDSATLRISATNITIENITVENSFDFLANDSLQSDNPEKITGSQAVALFIDAPSDRVLVRNVVVLGHQDTLLVNSGRSWFDKVVVAGTVDYIFGKGNALFTHSEIKTLARSKFTNPYGFITAPSTNINAEYGLTFINCRLTRDISVPDNSVALGRPWHPTTYFPDGYYADPDAIGKAVFINSWMDGHITKEGWYSMSGTGKDGAKKNFTPENSRFYEYNTVGPGAMHNENRRQLHDADQNIYSIKNIFGDWQPQG